MNVTTLMLRQHHRMQQLLSIVADNESARGAMLQHVLETASRFLRLQTDLFEPAVAPLVGQAVRMRDEVRVRTRIALFRMATASPESSLFGRSLEELREAMRAHALHQGTYLRALEREAQNPALLRLGRQLENALH